MAGFDYEVRDQFIQDTQSFGEEREVSDWIRDVRREVHTLILEIELAFVASGAGTRFRHFWEMGVRSRWVLIDG